MTTTDLKVCVLAHNEQKNIAKTIESLLPSGSGLSYDIHVYANGCTDQTVPMVQKISESIPYLFVHDLPVASKPLAWNAAFHDSENEILIFSDGDIEAEAGAIEEIYQSLISNQQYYISCCQFWPSGLEISLQQKIVGFMQIPFAQDFLSGQLYGLKRRAIYDIFNMLGLDGLPSGIVGEDAFLRNIVDSNHFCVTNKKVYYEPPTLGDYINYLARMRWQQKQIEQLYIRRNGITNTKPHNSIERLHTKIFYSKGVLRLLMGMASTLSRKLFYILNKQRINRVYHSLGGVSVHGASILNSKTRSNSTKI